MTNPKALKGSCTIVLSSLPKFPCHVKGSGCSVKGHVEEGLGEHEAILDAPAERGHLSDPCSLIMGKTQATPSSCAQVGGLGVNKCVYSVQISFVMVCYIAETGAGTSPDLPPQGRA